MSNVRIRLKRFGGILLFLIVALGGFYAGRAFRIEDGNTRAVVSAADAAQFKTEIARLSAENRRLAAASDHRRDDIGPVQRERSDADALARVNMLRDLKRRQIVAIRMPVVYNNGNLSDGFAELFALTAGETETLKRALAAARAEISRLSLANANVTRNGDSTVVTVGPFEGGADVYDRLMETFEHTLGSDRYAAMVDLHTDELPRIFSGFGAEQRTITITRDSEDLFRIQDTRKSASGSVGRTTVFSDASELSDFYSWLGPLLPPVKRLP